MLFFANTTKLLNAHESLAVKPYLKKVSLYFIIMNILTTQHETLGSSILVLLR